MSSRPSLRPANASWRGSNLSRQIATGACGALAMTLVFITPSWAYWRGHWRGGWGWGGPHVGIYLGPDPWWWDPYYDPYYYRPYPYYYPYYSYPYPYYQAPPAQPQQQAPSRPSPDTSHHQVSEVQRELKRARDTIHFELEDGDITKQESEAALQNLNRIEGEMRAESQANGGYLTGDQVNALVNKIWGNPQSGTEEEAQPGSEQMTAPPAQSGNLKAVTDQIATIRSQLDKKLADGDITKKQYNGMKDYLSNLEKRVQSDASANGGQLTQDQEEAARTQLERVQNSLNQNFIPPSENR